MIFKIISDVNDPMFFMLKPMKIQNYFENIILDATVYPK